MSNTLTVIVRDLDDLAGILDPAHLVNGRCRVLKTQIEEGVADPREEGGVRVPTIVRWPEKVKAGSEDDRISGFEDWMPTLLELIGAPQAATPEGIDGISLAPTLLGRKQKPRPFLYREFPSYGGQQTIRVGLDR